MRVIVVGAGILGASTAYHLTRRGADVVIIDAAHEGQATAAGAGIVDPWSSGAGDDLFPLLAQGAEYYPQLAALLAEDGEPEIGYRCVGSLSVAAAPAELDAMETRVRARAARHPQAGAVTRLDAADAGSLFPPLHPALCALHVAGAARVDGRAVTAALSRAAMRRGARRVQGRAALIRGGDRMHGVRVDGELIEADRVVVAAGAWASQILAPVGVALPVVPQRGQIVHLRLPGTDTRAWPIILPPGHSYLLAFDDSRVVVGATRETGSGFDYRVTAGGQAEVLATALGVAPGLAAATLIETRVGFRPMGPDRRPWLAAVRGLDGLLVGNGLGPSGLAIGPVAGRLLADRALGSDAAIGPPTDRAIRPWLDSDSI